MILNSHDSLANYYLTNFNLMFNMADKNFNPLDWDNNLLPFEKMIYIQMLNDKLEKDNAQQPPDQLRSMKGDPTKEEFEQ